MATAIMKKAMKALRSEKTSISIDTRKLKVSKMRRKKFNLINNRRMMRHFTIFI
jgi:hypothetical protein